MSTLCITRKLHWTLISADRSGLLPDWNSSTIVSHDLFDANVQTCLDTGLVFHSTENFRVDMIIAERHEDGIITVYFNDTVKCEQKQVDLSYDILY